MFSASILFARIVVMIYSMKAKSLDSALQNAPNAVKSSGFSKARLVVFQMKI